MLLYSYNAFFGIRTIADAVSIKRPILIIKQSLHDFDFSFQREMLNWFLENGFVNRAL